MAESLLPEGWEMVVGLEVHAELLTRTKLFSGAPNAFGGEPNTNVDPTSLGLPGSLPVLNQFAVELAIRAGLALNCTVQRSVFARKNYFYPDMPKDFQISQYDAPINVNGSIELPDGTVIGIERAHLEEDTGKSTHAGSGGGRIHDAQYSLVDYNRAGVPLLEIVSRPDITDPEQAKAYVTELRAILVAVGACDGKLEEGSLRVDANVSVRHPGEPLGTRCEIKNVNSLRSLGRAIAYEARRQVDLLTSGGQINQETRHYNDDTGRTQTLRSKEEATDYRYFPEPDLVEVDPDPEWIEAIRASLPVVPAARRHALGELGIDASAGQVLVERGLDELVRLTLEEGGDLGRVVTHATHNLAVDGAERLQPTAFARLTVMERDGLLTATQAKAVLAKMVDNPAAQPDQLAEDLGVAAVDADELVAFVDSLIESNPQEWERFRGGDNKVMGFFVGQVMKHTRGNADGKVVTALLMERKTR